MRALLEKLSKFISGFFQYGFHCMEMLCGCCLRVRDSCLDCGEEQLLPNPNHGILLLPAEYVVVTLVVACICAFGNETAIMNLIN